MPTGSLPGAGCASAAAASTQRRRSDLVALDPLLRGDPLLEARRVDALGLGPVPRVVRFARLADHVVDDAEVDERLGRVAVHALAHAEVALAQVGGRAVELDTPLLVRRRRLLGRRARLEHRALVASPPFVVAAHLPARRRDLARLRADVGLELLELGTGRGARRT